MKFLFTTLLVLLTFSSTGHAQRITLLFDAETLQWLEEKAQPFLEHAQVSPDQVRYRIVSDDSINAFVTGQRIIYFNSGLFLKATRPEEVIGVLAHEIGHIKGRHIIRLAQSQEKTRIPVILSTLAGIGAVIAGAPDAGGALLIGGQAAAVGNLLRYSRSQEWQADRIALESLNKAGYSADGLLSFFQELRNQELLYNRTPVPYLTTHPLSAERLNAVKYHFENKEKDLEPRQTDVPYFKRLQAKLYSLTNPAGKTLRKYGGADDTTSLYAQSIAQALLGKSKKALSLAKKLIEKEPKNPYFHELIGQIYIDKGDVDTGVISLKKAMDLAPNIPLLRLQYAEALLNNKQYETSLTMFAQLRNQRPEWSRVVRQMGIVHGRQGNLGASHLAFFEEALMKRNVSDAKLHRKLAQQNIAKNNKELMQRLDFLNTQLKILEEQ